MKIKTMTKTNDVFTVSNLFTINKNDKPFCQLELKYFEMDRENMLFMENQIVDFVNRLNNVEQPK